MRTDKTTANSGGFHYTLLISALGNLGPGGGTVENVLLSRFCSPLELASFHVYMLAPFLPIAMKLGRVVLWSMVYNSVKR